MENLIQKFFVDECDKLINIVENECADHFTVFFADIAEIEDVESDISTKTVHADLVVAKLDDYFIDLEQRLKMNGKWNFKQKIKRKMTSAENKMLEKLCHLKIQFIKYIALRVAAIYFHNNMIDYEED